MLLMARELAPHSQPGGKGALLKASTLVSSAQFGFNLEIKQKSV